MKFSKAITQGFGRAFRSLKPIIIIWLISLTTISLIAGPFKSAIISAVGSSFATEMISDGFSIDFWSGLNPVLMASMGGLFKGFILLFVFYIFIGVFLNGGLFDALKTNVCGYQLKDFFKASASNFFSFLIATILVMLMIFFAAGIIIGIPVLIVRAGDGGEKALFKVLGFARIAFILIIPIFLLVIDYSRAWLSASEEKRIFKALGYGFKATFGSFFSSYLFMVLIVAVQAGFLFLVTKAIDFNPTGTGGLFILFLLTQILFIVKLFLRAWRYGGVTTLHTI